MDIRRYEHELQIQAFYLAMIGRNDWYLSKILLRWLA